MSLTESLDMSLTVLSEIDIPVTAQTKQQKLTQKTRTLRVEKQYENYRIVLSSAPKRFKNCNEIFS